MAETLDRAVLAELLAAVGDDAAFVDQLVDTYLAEAPGFLDAIDQAVAAGDPGRLLIPAHTLKGNSTTIGAHALAEIARSLEMDARGGTLDGAAGQAAAARVEMERVMTALGTARVARWVA